MLNRECYFYVDVQDMGAYIPTCRKQDCLGVCPCDNCKSFLPMSKADKIIKSYLDKREEKQVGADNDDIL